MTFHSGGIFSSPFPSAESLGRCLRCHTWGRFKATVPSRGLALQLERLQDSNILPQIARFSPGLRFDFATSMFVGMKELLQTAQNVLSSGLEFNMTPIFYCILVHSSTFVVSSLLVQVRRLCAAFRQEVGCPRRNVFETTKC